MKVEDTVMKGEQARLAYLSGRTVEQQAEISFKAGIKEVVEWIQANSNLERGDWDVGLCFEDYLYFGYKDWQSKLKEWEIG